jgi:hypothetical protein
MVDSRPDGRIVGMGDRNRETFRRPLRSLVSDPRMMIEQRQISRQGVFCRRGSGKRHQVIVDSETAGRPVGDKAYRKYAFRSRKRVRSCSGMQRRRSTLLQPGIHLLRCASRCYFALLDDRNT